jgi:hypothetical protein
MPDVDDHHILGIDAVIDPIWIRSDPEREDAASVRSVPLVRGVRAV